MQVRPRRFVLAQAKLKPAFSAAASLTPSPPPQDSACPFAPQHTGEDAERCVKLVVDRVAATHKERNKHATYN